MAVAPWRVTEIIAAWPCRLWFFVAEGWKGRLDGWCGWGACFFCWLGRVFFEAIDHGF